MSAFGKALMRLVLFALLALPLPAFAHGGTTSRVPFEICEEQELGQSCEWDNGHGSLSIGTCRGVAPALRCVRNRPLVAVPTAENHHGDHAHVQRADADSSAAQTPHAMLWFLVALLALANVVVLRWKPSRQEDEPKAALTK